MVLALAGGSWIFLGAVLTMFAAVIYGFWTVRGSGIDFHPFSNPYMGKGGGPNRIGSSDGDRRRVSYSRGTSAGRGVVASSGVGRRGTRAR